MLTHRKLMLVFLILPYSLVSAETMSDRCSEMESVFFKDRSRLKILLQTRVQLDSKFTKDVETYFSDQVDGIDDESAEAEAERIASIRRLVRKEIQECRIALTAVRSEYCQDCRQAADKEEERRTFCKICAANEDCR